MQIGLELERRCLFRGESQILKHFAAHFVLLGAVAVVYITSYITDRGKPRRPSRYARRVSSSMRCLRMRLARVWYPLPCFFSHAITSASSRMETACFTGR